MVQKTWYRSLRSASWLEPYWRYKMSICRPLAFSVLSIFLFVSASASEAFPFPRHHLTPATLANIPTSVSVNSPADLGAARQGRSQDSYSQRSHSSPVHVKAYPRSSLPRNPPGPPQLPPGNLIGLGNDWLMRFLWADSGIPVQIASVLLEDFYLKVLERLDLYANPTDAMQALTLRIHDLHLVFDCDTRAISWGFVRSFVTGMLRFTRSGFTGKFLALLSHGPSGTLIKVGLWVITPQEPAESTGSN